MPRGVKKKVVAKKTNNAPKRRGRKPKEQLYPIDVVEKLTPIEGLKYQAMETELRNFTQGIRIAELEIDSKRRTANEYIKNQEMLKAQLKVSFGAKQVEYKEFINKIANERDLDPMKMAIDPESFVVSDLRETQAEGS